MEKSQVQHDVKNLLERLRIMMTMLAEENFEAFSREEILKDANEDLEKLKVYFNKHL